MKHVVVALAGGVTLGPMLIVFPPIYFPWTLLVAGSIGLLSGLVTDTRRTLRAQLAVAVAAALLLYSVALLVVGRGLTGSLSLALFAVYWWLLAPLAVGALLGAVARRRLGPWRALVVSIGGVATLAILGAVLALTAAPPEVANAPLCETGRECARSRCWTSAERRRFLAVERVTRYDGDVITCVYTAWGGAQVGTTDASRSGSTWDDGWWPGLLGGRSSP